MGSSPPTLHQREMAALVRPFLAVLLLLGAVLAAQGRRHSRYLLTSNSQRELLKEAGNEIDHGPGYTSQHKQHQWQRQDTRPPQSNFFYYHFFLQGSDIIY